MPGTKATPETTAVIPFDSSNGAVAQFSAFSSIANFESAQRMATLFSKSQLVPEAYRNNIPDCVIALEMASRIGASPLAVVQNLYIVHGRPAWSSQFLISCVNACGKFSPLRYSLSGEPGTDGRSCVAWAEDRTGERLEGPPVSVAIAKAEGWYGRNGSKWQTMPELMLRYRAATFFARTYAPELTMGMHTEEEEVEMQAGPDGTFRRATVTTVDVAAGESDAASRLRGTGTGTPEKPVPSTPPVETAAPATLTPEPAAKAPAADLATQALTALASVSLPADVAEAALRKVGKLGFSRKFHQAPAAVLKEILADPSAFAKRVGEIMDGATGGDTGSIE